MSIAEQAQALRAALAVEDLPRLAREQVVGAASDEVRDELARLVARTFDPPPEAPLLARLPLLRTERNEADLTAALLANLRSPLPEGRKASLYGLETMGYAGISDVAAAMLRDGEDMVVAAACDLFLRHAGDPARARAIAEGVYELHRDDPRFYRTLAVLQGLGVGSGPPPQDER